MVDNEIDSITETTEITPQCTGLVVLDCAVDIKIVSSPVIDNNKNCCTSFTDDHYACTSEDITANETPDSLRNESNTTHEGSNISRTLSSDSRKLSSDFRNVSFKSWKTSSLSRKLSSSSSVSNHNSYRSDKVADARKGSTRMSRQLSWAPTSMVAHYDDQQYEGRLKCSQVIAVLCGCISVMLLMLSIAATTWLEADGRREGLWELCKWRDSKGIEVDCEKNNPKIWIHACRSLCLISLFSALISVIVACIGLKTENFRWKYHYYKASMIIMFFAVTCEAIALIIFPVKFLEEIEQRQYKKWEFGWAYGIGWGSAIFMFGCAVLLLLDRDSEEVIYREKTIYQREPEPEDV